MVDFGTISSRKYVFPAWIEMDLDEITRMTNLKRNKSMKSEEFICMKFTDRHDYFLTCMAFHHSHYPLCIEKVWKV